MIERLIQEWTERGIGTLIIGGFGLLAQGLREQTKDLDVCLTAKQCPKMLDWLIEKSRQGVEVQIRAGSAPLDRDWLGRGWTCRLQIGHTGRVNFFGIPLCAPDRLVRRFYGDDAQTARASIIELGYLKRTERAQNWADIDLILGRLWEQRDTDATLAHLFGDALVEHWLASRELPGFRKAVHASQQACERPILRLGLSASEEESRAMAQAERRFWEVMGALCSQELHSQLRLFWRDHENAMRAKPNFQAAHRYWLAAATVHLPVSPVDDPQAMIDAARVQAGAHRWPGVLPKTGIILSHYFPEYRIPPDVRTGDQSSSSRPLMESLSAEERQRVERSLEVTLKAHWGPDRFEADRARFTPPAWLAKIPQLPERDESGRLPGFT